MANGANLILQGLQPAVQQAAPVSNFLQGIQQGQTIQTNALANQLSKGKVDMLPLEKQALQANIAATKANTQGAQFDREKAELQEAAGVISKAPEDQQAALYRDLLKKKAALEQRNAAPSVAPMPNAQVPGGEVQIPNAQVPGGEVQMPEAPTGFWSGIAADADQLSDDEIIGMGNQLATLAGSDLQVGTKTTFGKDSKGIPWSLKEVANTTTGDIELVYTNLNTGERGQPDQFVETVGGQTPSERVTQAGNLKAAEKKQERLSKKIEAYADQAKQASQASTKLQSALRVSDNAGEGVTQQIKRRISAIYPGLDLKGVDDIALLNSLLFDVALNRLATFKGQTTDFELGKTIDAVGKITDPKVARRATLAGYDRANWLLEEENRQFTEFRKTKGADPDMFEFDFDKPIQTNQGKIPLRTINNYALDNHRTMDEALRDINQGADLSSASEPSVNSEPGGAQNGTIVINGVTIQKVQ